MWIKFKGTISVLPEGCKPQDAVSKNRAQGVVNNDNSWMDITVTKNKLTVKVYVGDQMKKGKE